VGGPAGPALGNASRGVGVKLDYIWGDGTQRTTTLQDLWLRHALGAAGAHSDEPRDRGFVRDDADNVGASLARRLLTRSVLR
jgi:hypothetical protein